MPTGMGGKVSLSASPQFSHFCLRCREMKELIHSFTISKGQRQHLNPRPKRGLFPLSHSSSIEDYTSPFMHSFIQQISMSMYYVSGTVLAMRIQQ